MFSFAFISEHINWIYGNLLTMKEMLALFYLIAPLTTPLWLLWPGPSRALPRGWLWAVAGHRVCPKPAGPATSPTVTLLPWLCWHTQLCSPAGGTTAPETWSPTRWESPRTGTVLVTTVLHLLSPLNASSWWAFLISMPIPAVTAARQANLQTTSKGLTTFVFPGLSKKQVLYSLLPDLRGNSKAEQSPLPKVLYLKHWEGGNRRRFPGSPQGTVQLGAATASLGIVLGMLCSLGLATDQLWLDSWNVLCWGNFQPFPLLKAVWLQEISQQSTE